MVERMGQVHDILEARGKQGALQLDFDRNVVEAASAYMADEDGGIGFLYSGWCQAALPHRRLPDHKGWQVSGDRYCLIVEPGMRRGAGGEPVHVGVPFGSRASTTVAHPYEAHLRLEQSTTSSRRAHLLPGSLARRPAPNTCKPKAPIAQQGMSNCSARLILIYLQSEALRTGSREVVLGKSLRDWMSRMGIPV